MRYLVTGAAGFIGFHVCDELLRTGHEVIGVDSMNGYYRVDLKEERVSLLEAASRETGRETGPWSFRRLEIEDREALDKAFDLAPVDRVIHLAAQAGVRYSITNPHSYASSNLEGFLNVLEACRKRSIAHLAFASSSSVYGMNRKVPFSESDAVDHPVSLYAATKRANELMAHTYSHLYGLPATAMRFFTVYGPYGRPDMAYFKFADAIMAGREIEIFNSGNLLRDFTYIDDVVTAVIMLANRPPEGNPSFDPDARAPDRSSAPFRVYNIGNSRPERLEDFIRILEDALGTKAVKKYLPMQPGDVYMTAADTSALERDFGWKPSTRLAEGIARFTEWYKERKPWLQ